METGLADRACRTRHAESSHAEAGIALDRASSLLLLHLLPEGCENVCEIRQANGFAAERDRHQVRRCLRHWAEVTGSEVGRILRRLCVRRSSRARYCVSNKVSHFGLLHESSAAERVQSNHAILSVGHGGPMNWLNLRNSHLYILHTAGKRLACTYRRRYIAMELAMFSTAPGLMTSGGLLEDRKFSLVPRNVRSLSAR